MNVSTIICTYIYQTFVTVKTALEVTQAAADKILDTIYGIVKLALVSIRELLNPVIRVIRSSIASLMKSIGPLWIRDFSDTKMCQNLYKCEFFRDYLLNPDSIFSKAVKDLFDISDGDRADRVQRELDAISRDFQQFKIQICSGVSLDFTMSAITGLFQDFLAQVNKWLRWLRRKVDAIYKWLRHYLDSLKRWGVFELLNQLKAMFSCVLDETDLCASVESAGSFYRSFTGKMKLYCTKANDWIIRPDYEKMCTSYAEGKIRELSDLGRKLENGLRLFVNPSNVKPTTDCLNLAGHITGIAKAVWTGDGTAIPVFKYFKTTVDDLITAWRGSTQIDKSKYTSIDTVLSDLSFRRDGIYVGSTRLDLQSSGSEELSMTIDESTDASSMSAAILIGDDLYSASYALYEMKTNGDTDIVNYFNEYGLSYTDLISLDDVAKMYA